MPIRTALINACLDIPGLKKKKNNNRWSSCPDRSNTLVTQELMVHP